MKVIAVFAILICNFLMPVSAENLMRFFYTPAERANIDANRSSVSKGSAEPRGLNSQTKTIQYKGFVKRKGHPDVIWVNNDNTLKSKKVLSDVKVISVRRDGKAKLRVKGKGVVKLKPGQLVSRQHKKIQEAYENK